MQNATWVRLLRMVPAAMRQRLTVITNVGAEISIQELVQMTDEYLVLRGRLAGTNETGRLFLVPYSEITYVSSIIEMREDIIRATFCGNGTAAAAAPAAVEETPAAETSAEAPTETHEPEPAVANNEQPSEPPDEEPKPEPSPAQGQQPKPAGPVNRAELLQRIRSRSNTGSVFRPGNGG
jgi:hypothetical protein